MHVDGAYGAAAVICERGRRLLDGIELADSLSFDPHKWLFQPIECGCVLLRDAALLKATYRIMPEYLADVHRNVTEVNPCDYGIQLTRGFRALKVWMSIQYFGLDAFRAAVERGFELAEMAEAKAAIDAWLGGGDTGADGNRLLSTTRRGRSVLSRRCTTRCCAMDSRWRRRRS